MSALRRTARGAGALLAVFTLLQLARDWRTRERSVTIVLTPEEVRAAALVSGYPEEDVWERARTIGADAALVELQPLSALIDRGDIIHFSRAEAQKWAAAGLVAPGSPLKANTLWSRRKEVFSQSVAVLRAWGVAVSTQTSAGMLVAQLPADEDPRTLPGGQEPQANELRRLGLMPVIRCRSAEDVAQAWSLSRGEDAPSVLLLDFDPPGPRRDREDLRDVLSAVVRAPSRIRLALPAWRPAARWGALAPQVAPAVLAARIRPQDGLGPLLRAVAGDGARVVLAGWEDGLDAERSLGRLRAWASALRQAGFDPGHLSDGQDGGEAPLSGLRRLAAFILAALAPLWAMRLALETVRRSAGGRPARSRWTQASPVPEVAGGLCVLFGVSAAAGLAAHALLFDPAWRVGAARMGWTPWAYAVPFLLSAGALFPERLAKVGEWPRRLRRPVTFLNLLQGAALVAGLLLLTAPGVLGPALRVIGRAGLPWWVVRFWREAFIGVPCLVIGLSLHLRRLSGPVPRPPSADPRPWLLLGLLAPIGLIHELGLARALFETSVRAAAGAWALGAVLAAAVLGAASLRERGCSTQKT